MSTVPPTKTKELAMLGSEVVEGAKSLTPLVLRNFDDASLQELYADIRRLQISLQNERVALAGSQALCERSYKLQQVLQTVTVLEAESKKRNIALG